ncbi:ABC transporter ATP-binding protein [Fulvivirga sediminis]|uniref:ATP-binding cassette domain-containing protein n=1 Tax=Fulvivirga sediminis TaxID=2803949 RepID=A0A937JYV8_9BACT|nr:ABC transporter transmembrane domain-containing protein [Fulvivirga sediminis]MBL3654640.1 ATP-binding cassette domain-containing protein [Fulvivirga sediminis]
MAKRRGREPLKEGEKRKLDKKNFAKLIRVFRYILPYKSTFIFGMVCLFFSSTTLLGFPYFAGKLIDIADGKPWVVVPGKDWIITSIGEVTLILIGILFIQSIFSFFRVYLFALVNERSMADLRQDLFGKILMLPIKFFDNRRVGELISRITSDVSLLQDTFSITLAELFRQMASLIIGTVIIAVIAPKLTLFMICTFPVVVIAALVFGKFIRNLSKSTQDKLAETNVIVEETIHAVNTVKAFTNEIFEINRYTKKVNETVNIALKTAKYRGMLISFIIFALLGALVAIMWYGATLVQNGHMSVGDLMSFVLYTAFIGGSLAGLGEVFSQIQRAIGASERVIEIINETPETRNGVANKEKLKGDIIYDNVTFAYPGRKEIDILKGLNLTIKEGQKIALVGPSGAGKSTIIQLLMRFYNVDSGNIVIDNKTYTEYDLAYYRSNIGIVPQEVMLFGGSIKENIEYAKPGATEEEIKNAAEKANALEFIENFPEKFDTLVGDRGIKLSGGQRQRIAIARAILKDPSILILDEATSALDAESEVLVQEALDKLMEGRTTIMIAHRLSTIRKADNIFVIKNGNIVESGTHEELSTYDKGIYSHLLSLQFQAN